MSTIRDKIVETESAEDIIAILSWLQAQLREMLEHSKGPALVLDDRRVAAASLLRVQSDLQSMAQAQRLRLEKLKDLQVVDDELNMEEL